MPWWAFIYLGLFVLTTIAGVSEDLERPHKWFYIPGEFVCAIFVCIFVVTFFYEDVASYFGAAIFLMVGTGVIFEFAAAKRVIDDNKEDSEFTEKENAILNDIGMLLGNLFIVPGYVFGFMAGINQVSM